MTRANSPVRVSANLTVLPQQQAIIPLLRDSRGFGALLRKMALCALFFTGTIRAVGQEYFVTHLPPMQDESTSVGFAINNYGHVVGEWTQAGGGQTSGYYYDGQKHDLGPGVHPRAISDNGLVAGYLDSGEAFLYDPATGVLESLGTLGGPTSIGVGINIFGEVVGESQMPTSTPNRAFLFSGGLMVDLGVPTNLSPGYTVDYTKANGINAAGLVVGEALVGSFGEAWAVPFLFDWGDPDATMLKLTGDYSSGSAWALNDVGHIVGWASSNIETWGRAFLHDGSAMTNLGTIPGKSYTIATAVSNLDEVVGQAFGEWVWLPCCGSVWSNNIKRAFVYKDGAMVDLNTLIPSDAGGTVTVPTGINDSGKILTPLGGETVILTPIITADSDDDGDLDIFDFAAFADCNGGPRSDPDPTLPMLSPNCIRLFDFDLDYDIDMADFVRFQIKISQPGIVTGTVEYTGVDQGVIYVVASDSDGDGFDYSTSLDSPGAFVLEVWRTGDYDVTAFLDANGNGEVDTGEPFAPSIDNSIQVIGEGGLVANVLVDLGPYSVQGRITHGDGTPASGVTVSFDGPSIEATTTDTDGVYSFSGLLGGGYTVTPSDPARYFYPFDVVLSLVGGDSVGIDFEAHDLPTGEVDGQTSGLVSGVDPGAFSITIDDGGILTTVFVYAETVFSGAAGAVEEVTVGHAIEAQYHTSTNLAVQIDTDPPG